MYERVDKTRSLYDLYNNRYNIREITVSLLWVFNPGGPAFRITGWLQG